MPIFTRRRLEGMLNELSPLLDEKKRRDFLSRLEESDPKGALGAEMEVALLWGIKQVADLEIEPEIPGKTSRPEALSKTFFNAPAFIEITAVSDGKLSGEEDMQRAANIITGYVNRLKKGYGHHLYFRFNEKSGYVGNTFIRTRCVAADFQLDKALEDSLKAWVNRPDNESPSAIRLQSDKIDVVIEWKEHRQIPGHNYWCTLPPIAYDLESNPVFTRLKDKARQLSGVPEGTLKVIFLADAGSHILMRLNDKDHVGLQKSGNEIIQHFLSKNSVHAVCVFSPKRENIYFHPAMATLNWKVTLFTKEGISLSKDNLDRLLKVFPKPNFEGYQARSLQMQGVFSPTARGHYVPTHITTGKDLVMKISARALQQLLAGTINPTQFHNFLFSPNQKNLFKLWLEQGNILSDVTFEEGGIDEDDDYVVFKFKEDPAAAKIVIERQVVSPAES